MAILVSNSAPAGGIVSADGSISTHSDVDTETTPPVSGDLLEFDGALWAPKAPNLVYNNVFNGSVTTLLYDDDRISIRFEAATNSFQYLAKTGALWGWIDGGSTRARLDSFSVSLGDISLTDNVWEYLTGSGNFESSVQLDVYGTLVHGHLYRENYDQDYNAFYLIAGGHGSSCWAMLYKVG